MKVWCSLLLSLLACTAVVWCDDDDDSTTEAYKDLFRHAIQAANASGSISTSTWNEEVTHGIVDFDCTLNPDKPIDVHSLSPQYVDVVAAMGDSVTAGFGAGAKNIFDGPFTQYRGLSYSIGGDDTLSDVVTLPNIIRIFNPDVTGFSVKTGKPDSANAGLNVAVSGARCNGMPGQAEKLVSRMAEKGITDEQWKVVTLWIGGNDFCAIKDDGTEPDTLAKGYVEDVKKALNYLHDNLRNTYVNMVLMIDIADLHKVKGLTCDLVHLIACNSIRSETTRTKVTETVDFYNKYLVELVNGDSYRDRNDFTVELQPFFTETPVPLTPENSADMSYFAPDCFHFSQKAHGVGAIYLWNNMFEPEGTKTTEIDWYNMQPLACARAFPYFRTYKNSIALQANSIDQGSPHSKNPIGVVVGTTGVGVVLVALSAIVIAMGVIKMRSRRAVSSENLHLLPTFTNNSEL